MVAQSEAVPLKEKIGYGLGDFANCMFWQLIGMFLLYFYTDVFGISAGVAGTMFLVTRIWDSVNDPIFGSIADRTNSRWGKFRPYILFTAIPFGIIGVLIFTTPDLSPTGKIVYAYITYTMMGMAYTVLTIPYVSLMGVITSNSLERTTVSSFRCVGAFMGGIFIQLLTLPLVRYIGRGNEAFGFQMAAAFYAVLAVILYVITFLSTKERVHPPVGQKTNIVSDIKDLLNNTPWVLLFWLSFCLIIFTSIRGAVSIYYFKYYIGDTKYVGYFLAVGSATSLIGILCVKWFTAWLGKRKFFIILMVLTAVFTLSFYFFRPGDLPLIFISQGFYGLVSGPPIVLVWAMYADAADYSEWKNGRRATALIFSASSFAQKFGWTIGGAAAGWMLALYGFEPNMAQDAGVQGGIKLVMSVIPAIPCIFCVVFLYFYKLSETRMREIEDELKQRRYLSGLNGRKDGFLLSQE